MRKTLLTTHQSLRKKIEKQREKKRVKQLLEKFTFVEPSLKQKKVFTWWRDGSPVKHKAGIICDGSIRSGKTLCVSSSFLDWSMSKFNNKNFALCGKTIGTFRRNIIKDLKSIAKNKGYKIKDKRAENCLSLREISLIIFIYLVVKMKVLKTLYKVLLLLEHILMKLY